MENFSFTDPKVLETLLNAQANTQTNAQTDAQKRGLEFMGIATSDFQANPYVYEPTTGIPQPRTDWEVQIYNITRNKKAKILGRQDILNFPHFFEKKDRYIKRSIELGANMFRLSFDFGRLCSEPEEFNIDLMRKYIGVLASLREKGLEPMVTLYHWPAPAYLLKVNENGKIKAGVWEHPDILKHFRFYIKNVVKFLADKDFVRDVLQREGFSKETQDRLVEEGLVRYFITINEPINLLLPSYITGVFPPYKKFRFDLIKKVTKNIVAAHTIAVEEIRSCGLPTSRGPLQVGVAHNWTFFEGLFGRFLHWLINEQLTKKFEESAGKTDFLGLQYYFRMKLSLFGRKHKIYGDDPYFGDVYPSGIFEVLKKMNARYPNKDIFITEFGFSDNDGLRRPFWILETIRYCLKALDEQIPIKGILLWTLVNNFEWNLGLNQKFGLFDERDLDKPLTTSNDGTIQSWEVWRAAANAFTKPSTESLAELQHCYEVAQQQFTLAISRKKRG